VGVRGSTETEEITSKATSEVFSARSAGLEEFKSSAVAKCFFPVKKNREEKIVKSIQV
jgi:hypothetical protein